MTLRRLGRRQEAEKALTRLRKMFPQETRHDDFQPLVMAEKVFSEKTPLLSMAWTRMEQGHLEAALECPAAAGKPGQSSGAEDEGATMSAQRQLALRFAARARV